MEGITLIVLFPLKGFLHSPSSISEMPSDQMSDLRHAWSSKTSGAM